MNIEYRISNVECRSERHRHHFSFFIFHFSLIALFLWGCGGPPSHTDTPTSGVVKISSDGSYKPIIDAEKEVFEALYSRAHVLVRYTSEDSCFTGLNHDSARVIVVSRQLTKGEENYFHSKQLFPEQVKVAVDAIALIVNKDNPDTLMSYERIVNIFSGKDSDWSEGKNGEGLGKISVVFDRENSGNIRYIRDSILHGAKFPDYCFAVNSNPQVIDYVSKNKNALGIIGVNWVSNDYDSTVVGFLNKVKVVGVSRYGMNSAPANSEYYQPYQAYMQEGYYPLCRDIYFISIEPYTGLGSGFLAFVTSDRGQRIILREGILPASVPTHIIKF